MEQIFEKFNLSMMNGNQKMLFSVQKVEMHGLNKLFRSRKNLCHNRFPIPKDIRVFAGLVKWFERLICKKAEISISLVNLKKKSYLKAISENQKWQLSATIYCYNCWFCFGNGNPIEPNEWRLRKTNGVCNSKISESWTSLCGYSWIIFKCHIWI